MKPLLPETIASLAAIAPYLLAWAMALVSLRRPSERWWWVLRAALAVGLALEVYAIWVRWADIGHPPIFGSYENTLACSLFLVAGTLAMSFARRARQVALGTVPLTIVTLLWGLRFNTHRIDLTISERSLWIDLHAFVAWVAYFIVVAATLVAILVIAHAIADRRGRSLSAELPSAQWAGDVLVQTTSYAFLGLSALLATGAWYSWLLFGEAWRWDTVEVLGFVTWLALGAGLHLRLFYGWRGWKLASIMLFGFVGVIVMFWVLALFPVSSYHFFELPF